MKPSMYLKSLLVIASILLMSACTSKEETPVEVADKTEPLFKRVSSQHSGVTFNNVLEETYDNFFDFFAYVYNGAGVGIGDINNDGLSDIYFTGNQVPNRLYLNQGNLVFKDITESAGVGGGKGWNNGVTMVDINGDGNLDIYVCRGGWQEAKELRKNLLFINQGDLTFKEQADDYGLGETNYSIHAAFFDMDNDNDLDVYITNRPDSFNLPLTQMISEKKLSKTENRDKLFINENGKFREIGREAGITNNFGYALSVVTADLNGDGYTDIFVANDFAEGDYLYINQQNGTFKEQIKDATNHISMYSMGTDIADINNDGLEDIFVSEMLPEDYKRSKVSMPSMDVEGFYEIVNSGMHKQYMHNALHLNQGNLFFSDISQLAGVTKTEWSWSCLLADFDNDGDRDLFVANGYKRDVFDGDVQDKLAVFARKNRSKYKTVEEMFQNGFKDFIEVYEPIKVNNYLFKNNGNLKFSKVSELWGFTEPSFSNGAAIGDLDNDGDLDMVINNLDDEAFVYENTSSTKTNYLKIKLEGPAGNTDGLGAKVTLFYNNQIQFFENKTVRGYLSSNDPIVHFGLGNVSQVDSIHVRWSDGKENEIGLTKANQLLKVSYESAKNIKSPTVGSGKFLEESTHNLFSTPFVHHENSYYEYHDQILLPHMFSKSGPFISSGDVSGDGTEDFYIGGAAGQAGSLYVQRNGVFGKSKVVSFEADKAFEDLGSTLFDFDGDGDLDLYVVSGGSEFPEGSPNYNDRLYINDGKGNFGKAVRIPTLSSGSSIVTWDVDHDGDLDVFRGGQVMAGKYPQSPRSYLLINENGKLFDKTESIAPDLVKAGMVTSSVVADLNGDGKAELIVVGEWMPIRIFSYVNSKLEDVSASYRLQNTEGWWNKVVAADLDGDGDQDLILGNLGENYKFSASDDKPFQVFAKDFDGNGTNDVFLARYLKDTVLVPIRGRECTSQQVPDIARKFPTFTSFAESNINQILGSDIKDALHLKAYLFSSIILINNNGRLDMKRLPTEAQFSTVNGIYVDDFNKDGIQDILISGNKFDVEVETTAADASPGILMIGQNNFNYKCLKPFESGFSVPYNVKDMQVLKTGESRIVLVGVNNGRLVAYKVK